MNAFRSVIVAVAVLSLGTGAYAESVFRVVIRQDGSVVASGLGVLVAKELVLTGEALIAQGEEALVEDATSGAKIVAEIQSRDPKTDLALLSVPSLNGEPIPLALEPSDPGRQVYLRGLDGVRREGVFHSRFTDAAEQTRYRFTAIADDGENAAPLMNSCDELLALSQTRAGAEETTADASFGESNTLPDLTTFLNENEVESQMADQPCPSLQEQLTQAADSGKRLEEEKEVLTAEIKELEEALSQGSQQRGELEESLQQKKEELAAKQADLDAAASQRTELEQRIVRNEAERNRVEAELEQTEAELERAEAEIQQKEQELSERDQQEQAARRTRWYLGGGIGTALFILAALLLHRSRKRRSELDHATDELQAARSSLERSNATFSDIILRGDGPNGHEIRVKIIGNALARAEHGQVIGRSSGDADYVVAEQSVSRRHALLRVSGDVVTIEDLNSLNGTAINGVELKAGEQRVWQADRRSRSAMSKSWRNSSKVQRETASSRDQCFLHVRAGPVRVRHGRLHLAGGSGASVLPEHRRLPGANRGGQARTRNCSTRARHRKEHGKFPRTSIGKAAAAREHERGRRGSPHGCAGQA